jgi:hypothetical protein
MQVELSRELKRSTDELITECLGIISDFHNPLKEIDSYKSVDETSFDEVLHANKDLFAKSVYTNLSGAVEFEGEVYSPSRMHYLERRLKFSDIIFDREVSFIKRHNLSENVDRQPLSGVSSQKSIELFYRFISE